MKHKYLLLTIILFTCLFLFSTPSFALIPGDFGSAGGGPPDGVVDFEDLMIFAMAYGSTPSDPNWNSLCDIAGQGSTTPTPDGVIDFEDLMIFAMHYGEEENINPFVGYWINEDTNTGGITKINIQENNNLLEIHIWGKCFPTDCDWGIETTDISDAADGILNLIWEVDFAIKTQELILLSYGRLKVITFVDFYPDDIYGREDYESTEYFEFLQSGEGVVTGI